MDAEKITFIMDTPNPKKHSTRFDVATIEHAPLNMDLAKFKPSFYIPKPFAEGAKKIRVTIEVVE